MDRYHSLIHVYVQVSQLEEYTYMCRYKHVRVQVSCTGIYTYMYRYLMPVYVQVSDTRICTGITAGASVHICAGITAVHICTGI